MSGPWEDFASTPTTTTNAGPWEDFAVAKGSKPWEDFSGNAQKLSNTGAQTQPSLLNRGLSKVGQGLQYVEGKMQPLLSPLLDIFREDPGEGNIPPSARRFAEATETYGPPTFGAVVPGIAAGIVPINTQVPGHEMRPPPSDVPLPTAMVAPGRMLKAGAEIVNPLNTALAISTMGAGELAPAVAKALGIVFGTQIAAESLPQQLGQTSVEPTPENISDAAIQALMLGGIVHEVAPGKQQLALQPGANRYVSGEMMQGTPEMPFLAKNRPAIQLEDRPQFQERPPLIGQRPLTIEQQIVPPTQVNPGVIHAPELASKPIEQPSGGQVSFAGQQGVPSAMQSKGMVEGGPATYRLGSGIDLSGDFERYKEVQNLMKVAMAKGDQEGLMKAFAEMEQIKNRQPIRGMPPVEPAKPAATKASLRPAVEINGKLLVGDVGDTHADILTRNGIDPELYKHADPARGFTTDGKTLINRQEAAKIAGEEGTAKAGGLDSQDLRPGGNKDASGKTRNLYSGIPLDKSGKLKDSLKAYWMHFAGHLLPETEDYKLAREVVHDDLTPAKGNLPDEQAKSLEQEMQAKGFTKVIDDGKNIYVDNNASTAQLAGMKNKAKAEGKELVRMNLYSGAGLEEGDLGKFAMTASRLLRSPSRLKFNIGEGEAIDSGQLVNRLMNTVPPAEKAYLEGLGIREEFPAGKKATAKEVDEWIGEREPKVEVKTSKLGEGQKQHQHIIEVERRMNAAQHQLETQGYHTTDTGLMKDDHTFVEQGNYVYEYGPGDVILSQTRLEEYPNRHVRDYLSNRREYLGIAANEQPGFDVHWQSIAPKTEKEMPGYVEGAVTLAPSKAKDFEDYRLARGMFNHPEARRSYESDVQLGRATGQTLFPSSHSFPPNTLGFFRGYMEERLDGGKTFHVIEVQSDWANNQRTTEAVNRHQIAIGKQPLTTGHPLLKDWERLTLKAAIDHARKEGADRIAVSDAETAMMTEGHDRQGESIIPQEGGMRLHYDKILPKLLGELTGEEGKRVEFGEHRMALEEYNARARSEGGVSKYRKDLIFRNADSTPKTSVSATEFPLSKVSAARSSAPFTTFGKDKPHNLYSGINPFDTDSLTTILDRVFGHGVDRTFDEGLRHLEAKYHGYSAPHHVAASEDLANKLVRFAAADVYSQVKGLSHEETVAMRDQTFQRLIEAGIRDGVYKYGKAGEASTIDGQPTRAFDVRAKGIGHKSLRVRADLAPEFEMATTRKGKIVKEGAQMMLDLLTEAQIIGPTDFVFHTGNMFSSIIMSAGKTSNYLTDLAMRMPIAKQMDAVGKVGYEIYRDIIDDPSVQAEMERIAEIGALRGQSAHSSVLGKATGGVLDTGKWIQVLDRAGRRVRNKMFDNLVKQGLETDTELGRREFINKMGQYNDKLMSHVQAIAKNYTSQFVVAGRTFNRNAMHSVLASNEFRAANPTAYAKAKFSNIVSLMASAVVLPVVLNLVLNKKPFGRAGTPIGKIDTGKDDANGRPIVIDPMQTDLSRRGFRNLGGEAVVEGLREGREPLDITERAIWAIAMGQLHPWEGPPVRFLEAGIGKKKAGGTAGEAIMEALKAINPTITAALSKTEEGKPGGIGAVAQQLGGAIGIGKGRILSHVERVEKTVDKPITDLSLEDRILAEQRTKSERQPISEEQSTKAAVRAIESEGKRGEALKASFDKSTKQWLDSRQLTVPGYDNKLDFGKTRLYLNPEEEKRLDSLVKEEYQRTIEAFKTDKDAKDFDSLPSLRRQEVFHAAMTQAAKRAHGRMKEELDTKHPSKSNAQNMGKTGRKKRKYHVFGE